MGIFYGASLNSGFSTSSQARSAAGTPLIDSLNSNSLGTGEFRRDSIAWHMNSSNDLVESAVDIPRFTTNGL